MDERPDLLAEAKRRLPLPELMVQLGHADHAKRSARCPFHEDARNSFSIFPRADGDWGWKCHAGCGGGDEADYVGKARGLSKSEGCREFIRLAGIATTPRPLLGGRATQASSPAFNWPSCVAALTPQHQADLATWRGYSVEFVAWLHAQGLIGLFDGVRYALPVHDQQGRIAGCHYRLNEDGSWRYHPKGTLTRPLIVGSVASHGKVFAFESQWDAFAVMDKLDWQETPLPETAIVVTRGASNVQSIKSICRADTTVHAFAQNDPPNSKAGPAGQRWLLGIAANCGCPCLHVVTPGPHKDLNDWIRAGATRVEIEAAIASAQPVAVPEVADFHNPSARRSRPASPVHCDDGGAVDEPEPFPTDALPPEVALMVRATAQSLRVPEALPAVVALGLVSASIGAGLDLQSAAQRTTRANLFIIASAMSGSGKSEVFRTLAEPLLAEQARLQESFRTGVQPKLQTELRAIESQLKKLDRLIGKTNDPTDLNRLRGEMEFKLARRDEIQQQLASPLLVAQDTTVERLAVLLQQHGEALLSTSPDARKLVDNLLGRYSANKLTDESLYLSAFSGDHIRVDRQNRDPITLRRPCLSLLWLLQPDALEMLLGEDSLHQGGFLPRCLLAHTRAEPQRIEEGAVTIPDSVRSGWRQLIEGLLAAYRLPNHYDAAPCAEISDGYAPL